MTQNHDGRRARPIVARAERTAEDWALADDIEVVRRDRLRLDGQRLPSTCEGKLTEALDRHGVERMAAVAPRDELVARDVAVIEATRFLERNLVDAVTVGDLARLVDLSPSHLTALFRAHLGCPPLKYQQRLRLALARKLLRDSYLRVGEVAAACGYADPNYFIRVFRAAAGVTPSRWRRDGGRG